MKHNDGEMHLAVQIVLLTIGTVGLLAGIVLAIINGIAENWLDLSIALHFILGAISALAILTWHKWGVVPLARSGCKLCDIKQHLRQFSV